MPVPLTIKRSFIRDSGSSATMDTGGVCVGIATRGRPETLAAVVGRLHEQTLRPDRILIACTRPDDVAGLPITPQIDVLTGPAGLTRQRNAILRHLPSDTAVVVFFDDDFVADRGWLAAAVLALRENPSAGCVTGHVVVDGIKGPGLSFEQACAALARGPSEPPPATVDDYSPYGCNMAFRCRAIEGMAFDERLVLYGWLEDRDFGGELARRGWRHLKIGAACGVHMGVKSGRVAGRKLGYSQVMNPLYLRRKGTMRLGSLVDHVARNVTANLARSVFPEPYIDRRGRLAGNLLAVMDLLQGRITPERAERL